MVDYSSPLFLSAFILSMFFIGCFSYWILGTFGLIPFGIWIVIFGLICWTILNRKGQIRGE